MSSVLKLVELPAKVLIVEDEESLRESVAFRFEREGFSVFEATNGVEALRIINDQLPDIILTDVRMPKMGGKELLENIKAKYANGNIPIVFCITGYSDLTEKEAAELWVDRYFHKPLDPAVLVAAGRADLEKLRSRVQLKNKFLTFMKEENYEGFLVSAMMHEINNLLNVGNFSAQQIKHHFEKFVPDAKLAKAVHRVVSVFGRMHGVTSLLTKVIRDREVQIDKIQVARTIRSVADEVQLRCAGAVVSCELACPEEQEFLAIPYSPQMVLLNLAKNAYEALEGDERKISFHVSREENWIHFRVSNQGGIPDHIAARVFEPYFSTKEAGGESGMGIGLAIARNFVEDSRGKLVLETHKETTTFCVSFQAADA